MIYEVYLNPIIARNWSTNLNKVLQFVELIRLAPPEDCFVVLTYYGQERALNYLKGQLKDLIAYESKVPFINANYGTEKRLKLTIFSKTPIKEGTYAEGLPYTTGQT